MSLTQTKIKFKPIIEPQNVCHLHSWEIYPEILRIHLWSFSVRTLVWDFKPILPQGSTMFLINSKVSSMHWHIFPHWQRLFCHFRHLIDFGHVRLQSFEKSGTGLICVYHREVWLIMKGYSKRLNLCHKPLPSVLWAYVMSIVVCTKINKQIKYL